MLTIKKELSFYDFQNEYDDILNDIEYQAHEIIFDSLSEMFFEGTDDMTVRDYIRFQLQVMTLKEVLNDYNILDDEEKEDLNDEDILEVVEEYLNDNTYVLGSYVDDEGETVFLFDEF